MERVPIESFPAVYVSDEAPIFEVKRLIDETISRVIVVTREGQTIGTITDRELSAGAANLGREFSKLRAKHVLERVPTTLNSEADASDLIDAVILLRRAKARNLVIVRSGRPIGVVSMEALVRTSLYSLQEQAEMLSCRRGQNKPIGPSHAD